MKPFALLLLCLLGGLSPAAAQLVCPNHFAPGAPCTPITASATGSTGATTATLPAAANKTTYICGFQFMGTNATAAIPATNVTIAGTVSGTLNFGYPTLAVGAAVANTPPVGEVFSPCIPTSAINTAIVVNGPRSVRAPSSSP